MRQSLSASGGTQKRSSGISQEMFSLKSWNASGLQMHPREPVEKIILDIPFSYRDIAARAGARWDSEIKAYLFEKRSGQALPLELEGFEPKQFSWEEKIQRELNGGAFVKRSGAENR